VRYRSTPIQTLTGGGFTVCTDASTGDSEAARVTANRFFKASNTGFYGSAAGVGDLSVNDSHNFQSNQNNSVIASISSSTGSAATCFDALLPTGAAGYLFQGSLNAVAQFRVAANGSVTNTTGTYGSISDPKLKNIIGPKNSTWEKTKQYNWIEYYLKSDVDHSFKLLGLNAEEALEISPGVVDETPELVQVIKTRQVPVQVVRLDENDNPILDEEGNVVYDEIILQEEYSEWEPSGEFTKSVKYSVVAMQYHRTTQECQHRIENLESATSQTDDVIQQLMGRVAALESASA
jgi:hypothetical protein